MNKVVRLALLAAAALVAQESFGQASFRIPITLSNGTASTILRLGVNTGNTIGTDTSSSLGAFREVPAPPAPPAPFDWDTRFVTIPGRTSTFPIGLGGGVLNDNRGYFSPAQVDSYKITIAGDFTDNATTTVSWPSNLATFGTSWTIKPQVGSDWPTTNMLTASSVQIGAGLHKNIIIIKVGATGTNDVKLVDNQIPVSFALDQNYPNPFNPSTEIRFSLPVNGKVSLVVYNILGQEIATLLNEVKSAGNYSVRFDATSVPSGTYFYRLESSGRSEARKMLLLK
jgi:hypothetical protein